MSTSVGEASDEASEGAVYDYLYHDARRTLSFLGQLSPSGHVTGIKQSENASETEGNDFTSQGALTLGIGKGNWTRKNSQTSLGGEAVERTYDPLWANARAFFNILEERGLIQHDIRSARIGQFVVVTGALSIVDLGVMKTAWPLPAVQRAVRSGMVDLPKQSKGAPHPADMALELLRILPHPVHATLNGDGLSVWSVLQPESMVTPASDLLLAHGRIVDGQWAILGVLDARPDDPTERVLSEIEFDAGRSADPTSRLVATMMEALIPLARNLLGRPSDAYGITPLMIFRQIGE